MANSSSNYGTTINHDEWRIVMAGETGIGKSATGNTILGRPCFESKCSPKSMTTDCSKVSSTAGGQQVVVIDTPGLFDTRFDEDKTRKNLSRCVRYAAPGPLKMRRKKELEREIQEKYEKEMERIDEQIQAEAERVKRRREEEMYEEIRREVERRVAVREECEAITKRLQQGRQIEPEKFRLQVIHAPRPRSQAAEHECVML